MTTDHSDGRPRDGRGRYIRSGTTADKDAEACRLRSQGRTYEQIATQLGYPHRDLARRAVERALVATVREPAEAVRSLELIRLDQLWQRAWAVLDAQHVVISVGKVVTYDGAPVPDHAPVLRAIDTLLRIQERRARLLGLDAPTKVQAITIDQVDAEIARLTAELRATDGGVGDE